MEVIRRSGEQQQASAEVSLGIGATATPVATVIGAAQQGTRPDCERALRISASQRSCAPCAGQTQRFADQCDTTVWRELFELHLLVRCTGHDDGGYVRWVPPRTPQKRPQFFPDDIAEEADRLSIRNWQNTVV